MFIFGMQVQVAGRSMLIVNELRVPLVLESA